MKEKIDLSLNRSLEELISSYWEAVVSTTNYENEGIESSDFYVLENYLSDMGVLWVLQERFWVN